MSGAKGCQDEGTASARALRLQRVKDRAAGEGVEGRVSVHAGLEGRPKDFGGGNALPTQVLLKNAMPAALLGRLGVH